MEIHHTNCRTDKWIALKKNRCWKCRFHTQCDQKQWWEVAHYSFVFHLLTLSSGRHTIFYQTPVLWNKLHYSLWCSSSTASFKSAPRTHLFSSGLWMPCLCVCSCVPLVSDVCVLGVTWQLLNEVLQCVYVISRVHCALGCGYILLTLSFLYCAFWAILSNTKRLTNTLLHYTSAVTAN